MRFVYMIRCSDNSLYTGITKDLDKRIYDHNHSKIGAKYTKGRRPVKLVWSQKVKDRNEASQLELQIKKLGREKKEELISLKKFLYDVDILQKASKYYKKANNVQKAKICAILFSNIFVDKKKKLTIKVNSSLESIFSGKFSLSGDDGIRTHV